MEDVFVPCDHCGEEHPEGVLDGGFCPTCVDEPAAAEPTVFADAAAASRALARAHPMSPRIVNPVSGGYTAHYDTGGGVWASLCDT